MSTQPRALGSFFRKKRPHNSDDTASKRRKKIEFCVPSEDDDDDDDEVPIVETTNNAVQQDEERKLRIFKLKKRLAPAKLTTTTPNKPVLVSLEEEGYNTTPLTVDSDTEDCKPAAACVLSAGTIPLRGQSSVDSEEYVGTIPLQGQSRVDSEEEGSSFPPTIDSLKNTCWKCSAKFKLAKDEFCLYALHTHPLLKVPICSVCADEVLAVEIQSSQGDWCSGCGRHEDDVERLLLCDDCPRAFCDTCTALAHGGGEQGQKEADWLAESDDSWSCPYCKPPSPLQLLQAHTERIGSDEEPRQRTVDDIMLELDTVELERLECEKMALPKVVEQQRDEFRNELRKTMSSPDELEEAVEMEMHDWQEMWSKHDQRLADLAASLQDELEIQENVDLAACYEQLQGKTPVDSVEPAWKKAADAAIERREQEDDENDEPPVGSSDPSVYKLDIDDDIIEDLDTPDPDGSQKKSQWRHNRVGVEKEDIDEALKCEEEMLRQRNITVARVCNDKQDVRETEEEEHKVSARGAGGVSRIRRDVYQVVRQRAVRDTKTDRAPKKQRVASADSCQRVAGAACLAKDNEANLSEADSIGSLENDDPAPISGANIFSNSSLVLSPPDLVEDGTVDVVNATRNIRTVTIAEPLAKVLKPHQVEGIRFMWRNTFLDLGYTDASHHDVGNVGGCILAHNMGLGKSLSCVALVHALLNHPSLVLDPAQGAKSRLIRCVLLVVPTNVLSHWEEEFDNWTGQLVPSIRLYNLGAVCKEARAHTINTWSRRGGILLVSSRTFVSLSKSGKYTEALQDPGPDIVVTDEGHLMLTKTSNEIFKALSGIRTKRRIALTGSPIQNNLLEYFRMVSWARPGVLGSSEAKFDKEYVAPIMMGMASDSSAMAVRNSNQASRTLYHVLSPYVHRKDAKVLRKDLPPMQQCVLHIRQSKTQTHLYRAFKAYQKASGCHNFFKCYQMTRTLTNHPGTLLMPGRDSERAANLDNGKQRVACAPAAALKKPTLGAVKPDAVVSTVAKYDGGETISLLGDSDDEDVDEKLEVIDTSDESSCEGVPSTADDMKKCPSSSPVRKDVVGSGVADISTGADALAEHTSPDGGKEWWRKTAERNGNVDRLKDVENGYKVVLFLHILVQAQELGDKVLVFSQCLKTLDFIEEVLNLDDWGKRVPSLISSFPDAMFRAWRKNVDYLRIDGATQFAERGSLIAQFNDKESLEQTRATADDDKTKLFLLSSKAGGIGVNLVAANRVVLFDNHFNPTVMTQALYRCYRYGQSKPVFAYRFMTEGSMEEKIYSRSVNKTGVALRVIDGKSIGRSFTERELTDLQTTDSWVQCDRCEKWRMLPLVADLEDLPDKWFCEMNEDDDVNNNCRASEKDSKWYGRHYSDQLEVLKDSPVKCIALDSSDSAIPQDQKALLVERDEILKHLLEVTADKRKNSVISKYYFHDALLEETEDDVSDGIVDEVVGQELLSEHSECAQQKASFSTAATLLHFPEAELPEKVSAKNSTLEANVTGNSPSTVQAASSRKATGDIIAAPPTSKRRGTPSAVDRAPRKVTTETPNEASSSEEGGSPTDESKVGCHDSASSSTANGRKTDDRTSPRRHEADTMQSSREGGETRSQQESKVGELIDLVSFSSESKVEVIDLMSDSSDEESADESS